MNKEKEWPIGIVSKDFDIEEAAGGRRRGRMERATDLGGDEIITAAAREGELVVTRLESGRHGKVQELRCSCGRRVFERPVDRPNGIGGGGFPSSWPVSLRAVLVAVLVVGLERGWLLICGGSVCRGGRGGRPQ